MLPLTIVPRTMTARNRLADVTKRIDQLLFMDDLKLYRASKDQLDSLMSFGLDQCAVLETRRGKQVGSSGIDLPDNQHIREVEEEG